MSEKDDNANGDGVREIFVLQFGDSRDAFGQDMDFRPNVLPADAEEIPVAEETLDPKEESAVAPVSSPESPSEIEPQPPVKPAPKPVVKAPSPPKVPAPGKPAS